MEGANADSDVSKTIVLYEYIPFLPTKWTFVSSRTAGATDTVAVDLQGSVLGIEWVALVSQITDTEGTVTTNPVESVANHSVADFTGSDNTGKAFLRVRILVTTVGAGNTLDLHAIGVK